MCLGCVTIGIFAGFLIKFKIDESSCNLFGPDTRYYSKVCQDDRYGGCRDKLCPLVHLSRCHIGGKGPYNRSVDVDADDSD